MSSRLLELFETPLATRALYVGSFFIDRSRRLFEAPDSKELPPLERSLSLAAKQVLDEAALALVATSARLPSTEDRRRVRAEVAAALELFDQRGWLEDPASYHAIPPPLRSPEFRPTWRLGQGFEQMRFESGYEPHSGEPGRERWLGYAANRTAEAWVLRHTDASRPWIVCLHPFQMGSPLLTLSLFDADCLHRRLGLNVVCPVFPLHGPRKVGWRSGDGLISGDYMNTLHGIAQAVWDVRRILSWIRAQGSERVSFYGVSLGGCTTVLLSALERDIDCAIAGIPATDFVALERWHAPPFAHRVAETAGVDWDAAACLLRVVSPLALSPRVPWRNRYMFAGLGDRLAPPIMVQALWRHWECPKILWYAGGHLSYRFESSVARFVSEALESAGMSTPCGQ